MSSLFLRLMNAMLVLLLMLMLGLLVLAWLTLRLAQGLLTSLLLWLLAITIQCLCSISPAMLLPIGKGPHWVYGNTGFKRHP